MATPTDPIRGRLRTALSDALKRRDRVAVDVLRSTLGAIDNAEAVDAPAPSVRLTDAPIVGTVRGAGQGDVPRRVLSEQAVRAVVIAEIEEKRRACADYGRLGRPAEAERLRAQADLLEAHLP